jgi:hypothetical protein
MAKTKINSNKCKLSIEHVLILAETLLVLCIICCDSSEGGDDDAGIDDTGSIADDSATDDDSAGDDDTTPGNSGYFARPGGEVHRFKNKKIAEDPVYDFSATIDLVEFYQDFIYFAVFDGASGKIWKFHDDQMEMIYENPGMGDSSTSFVSMAFYSPDDFVLQLKRLDDGGNESYTWIPELVIESGGLVSGFKGGAYPYDQDTLYSYDGSLTALTDTPDGTASIAPLGEGFVALTDESVLYWDQTQWTTLASGTAQFVNTDPEGDILLGSLNEQQDGMDYFVIQDGALKPYDIFDASSCPFSRTKLGGALLAGNARAFLCTSRSDDSICDETWGKKAYLIVEDDGAVTCQGMPSEISNSFLRIRW